MSNRPFPVIIQGGMGAGVSTWRLAQSVSKAGQLGVVSGTALDVILARRLQLGDLGGEMRRALAAFPIPGVAERILERYFVSGGKAADQPFKSCPMQAVSPSPRLLDLLVAGNFVEVFLAREGHGGPVGINYLEKIQLPHLPSIFGAMLAGVDFVLMGAGIPRAIPGILDRLAGGEAVKMRIEVQGAVRGEECVTEFDPNIFCAAPAPKLRRPKFLAIVASATLATMLARKASGKVDGFIVEGPTAGGHNAPPRGKMQLSSAGEPIYGERDTADLKVIAELGLPFWLAGGFAEPERLTEALDAGATGIQVGTAFAYCAESGFAAELKAEVLSLSGRGQAEIFTDPVASPTGFPFKVLQLAATYSNSALYEGRARICDLGYLRQAYQKDDGSIGWRCPSEPLADYLKKGGVEADTVGRKCVCNGLIANIGMGQIRKGRDDEKPLVTSGDDVATVARFLQPGATEYFAAEVVKYLTRDLPTAGDSTNECATDADRSACV